MKLWITYFLSALPLIRFVPAYQCSARFQKGLIFWSHRITWICSKVTGKSFPSTLRKLAFAASIYFLWQERTYCIFEGIQRTPSAVCRPIEFEIIIQTSHCRNFKVTDTTRLLCSKWCVPFLYSQFLGFVQIGWLYLRVFPLDLFLSNKFLLPEKKNCIGEILHSCQGRELNNTR